MITVYNQNVWNCSPASYRNQLIRSLVKDFDADICTFQECGPATIRSAEFALPALLADVYAEVRDDIASKNFTPVFYKNQSLIYLTADIFCITA